MAVGNTTSAQIKYFFIVVNCFIIRLRIPIKEANFHNIVYIKDGIFSSPSKRTYGLSSKRISNCRARFCRGALAKQV